MIPFQGIMYPSDTKEKLEGEAPQRRSSFDIIRGSDGGRVAGGSVSFHKAQDKFDDS